MKNRILPHLILGAFLATQAAASAPRPNILYFYVDDMGWGSIGPNGQDARRDAGLANVLTPTIDSLADQGINFTRAYGCTVCSPARSSQQSGFHQGHTYADRNNTDNARKAMRADDVLMGDVLSAAGYVTGYWGKWGFGASSSQSSPEILNVQTLPTSHGYQYSLSELHHVRAHTFFQPTLWSAPAPPGALGGMELIPNSVAAYQGNTALYPDYPARQNHASYPATAYCDDAYGFAALDFVRAQGQNYNQTGQPFFGLLAVQVPHSPYDEIGQLPLWDEAYSNDPEFAGLSTQAKNWAAMVTRVDAHFGNILGALEDPNNDGDTSDSIVDNTLVIFMSDNGGPGNSARSELDANGGLRGSKGSIYEGGIRVPAVVRWPSMIHAASSLQAGTDSGLVIDVTDLLPTFCDLAGAETPAGIDGISLAPSLTGTGHQRTRDFMIHEAQPNWSIIRGDDKLVNGTALYDLAADHDESSNIAGSNAALVAELHALALGERVGASAWFSNTYHDWTGADQGGTSSAGNWSDYVYSNTVNGIVYQTDTGAPHPAWTATMANSGGNHNTAVVDASLELLSLEIHGSSTGAVQTLDAGSETVTGRNEIRLGAHAAVRLDGGTLASLRWVDLRKDAALTGAGTIDATLYHAGRLALTSAGETVTPGTGVELVPNGGFESGTGNSYEQTDGWINYGPSQTANARNTSYPQSGSYRAVVGFQSGSGDPLSPSIDTGYTAQEGDTFTLSFHHAGAGNWDLGSDAVVVTVFYDDGGHQTLADLPAVPSLNYATGYDFVTSAITATPASVGQDLLVRLEGSPAFSGGKWAAVDGVSLLREAGEPVTNVASRSLDVTGDYHAFDTAALDLTLAGTGTASVHYAQLVVDGEAVLDGTLALTIDPALSPQPGDVFTIVSAASITGTFDLPENRLLASDGTHFVLAYTPTSVTATAVNTTAQGTPYDWLEDEGLVSPGGDHETADLLDHDLDGMTAWEEFIAGTNPNDITSRFALSADPEVLGSNWTVYWPSAVGRIYLLDGGDTPEAWPPLDGPLAATPPENAYALDLVDPAARFVRVWVSFPL